MKFKINYLLEKSWYFLIKSTVMNSLEKIKKIMKAFADALQKKDNTTDILHYLKKEFSNQDIKKLFHNMFDKEYLKEENLLNEEQSKIDGRKIEYRLDELNKLYVKYVKECQKRSKVNCKKVVGVIILNEFFKYLDTEYDILKKIEKELINALTPRKERDREIIGFMSSNMAFEESIYKAAFKNIKKSIDVEKLTNEISILKKIINELKTGQ